MFGWLLIASIVAVVAVLVGYIAVVGVAAHRLTQSRRRRPLFNPR
ncbi:MAG: hypothetical protein SH847_17935 [Roseiflexaceae bacterium]|nr:hypothetical protein [Roseiflexaceae bacterium]